MKKAGHPRPADLARAAKSTTATISNWLNDHVSASHVKAAQLFRIADAAKLDARELLPIWMSGRTPTSWSATWWPRTGWRSTTAAMPRWTCSRSSC
ncbi:hypothetical protein G6F32_017153 [Rhizopus arrhizus]|nr:hypothetical protein G6F32_017153 [Rhizopus arrhizus]